MSEFSELKTAFDRLRIELAKAVVDQEQFIEHLMIAMLSAGHCLAEGPPGVARALTARSLAEACGLRFDRIRCTPDLLPADLLPIPQPRTGCSAPRTRPASASFWDRPLVGSGSAAENRGEGSPVPGPLSAHVVLVDDIARLSPKTNSVVQQAISGPTVKVDGYEYELPQPHLVLATHYVDPDLVDATPGPQDDRFMFKLALPYPPYGVDYQLADALTRGADQQPQQVLLPEQLMRYRQTVLQVSAPPPVIHYAVRLTRATRVHEEDTPDFVYEWVSSGAGPRAVHFLTLAAKARAALHGRAAVESDDVRQVTHAVLRHRISANQNARANGVSVNKVIDRLLYEIPEREPGDEKGMKDEG